MFSRDLIRFSYKRNHPAQALLLAGIGVIENGYRALAVSGDVSTAMTSFHALKVNLWAATPHSTARDARVAPLTSLPWNYATFATS